ncbi:MAG: hypothetical protein ACLQVJ_25475 [Syntrophobacteraceae bacterium]
MDLFPFQLAASSQIAERFSQYRIDPLAITITKLVPFYQNLASITGSGKTLILADAVEQIRGYLPVEPIVLWLSKGKVVVWQTYANLSSGKYAGLLGGYDVKPLLDCKPEDVENSERGLLLVATVGKFNQKDREQGDRKIFRVCLDVADQSLWDSLKTRCDKKGRKRPFIVVYDEGHNLSDQQTELLLELSPDALVAASATTRVPTALSTIINRLRQDKHWTDNDFVTAVHSSQVVLAGLVKKHILLGGYVTPMETAIDEMLSEMNAASKCAEDLGLPFRPKAIYVSNTNAIDGVSIREDMQRPFDERLARPILIWKHLVDNAGVNPSDIAVYCDLKFDSKLSPPLGFNLFAGGDSDYDKFIAGNFRHIIFNLSLQEGWDDPECCFAYIDKDMGSPDQVTQVVGRVLRQPGAQHYPSPNLNTAHFYIRTDEKGVFDAILNDIKRRVAADCPDITMTVRKTTKGGQKPYRDPLKPRQLPTVSIYSAAAQESIKSISDTIIDFRTGGESVIGKGDRVRILQNIGSDDITEMAWVDVEHSNRVTARWVMKRELQRLFPSGGGRQHNPVNLCDIEHVKFDAFIEFNSSAALHFRDKAKEIVDAYIQHSVIIQNFQDHPYKVGSVPVDETKLVKFKNALHEGYSDLNGFERDFAEALDKTQRVWCRNPSQGGFGIPLLDYGKTRTFNPDFFVWAGDFIIAIDPKGDHLISEDSARKLFDIEKVENGPELLVRLVTEGKWSITQTGQVSKQTPIGYTVWVFKNGRIATINCSNINSAVSACLKT